MHLVSVDGVAALVSDAPEGGMAMGREAATTHARVLGAAHSLGTILPMRAGVLMSDETDVIASLLEPHRHELLAQLQEFEGKAELTVSATYKEDSLLREVIREDQDVARLRESLRGSPADDSYYGRIQLGELVSRAIERKRKRDAAAIMDALSPLALAVELASPPHDRIVLAASFLVESSRMAEFDAAVERVGDSHSGRLCFRRSGPLPPISFVTFASVG